MHASAHFSSCLTPETRNVEPGTWNMNLESETCNHHRKIIPALQTNFGHFSAPRTLTAAVIAATHSRTLSSAAGLRRKFFCPPTAKSTPLVHPSGRAIARTSQCRDKRSPKRRHCRPSHWPSSRSDALMVAGPFKARGRDNPNSLRRGATADPARFDAGLSAPGSSVATRRHGTIEFGPGLERPGYRQMSLRDCRL